MQKTVSSKPGAVAPPLDEAHRILWIAFNNSSEIRDQEAFFEHLPSREPGDKRSFTVRLFAGHRSPTVAYLRTYGDRAYTRILRRFVRWNSMWWTP